MLGERIKSNLNNPLLHLQANKFVQDMKPWHWIQHGNESERQYGYLSLYLAGETLRLVGILIQPVIPEKAAMLLDLLSVSPTKRMLSDAVLYADKEYGAPDDAKGRYHDHTLFPPLWVED